MDNDLPSNDLSGSAPLENALADDHSLVEAAQRGDRSALAALIERHQGAVYGYLRARLFDAADAKDLCQEVFLRCCTANARFDSSSLVRPGLIGIARNLLRERVRRIKRRAEAAWTELCLELETSNPPDHERRDAAIRLLPDCLNSLGPTAREALDLHYRGSLRPSEIGDRLHRSEGAVRLLLFRARQAVRLCLNGKI